MIYIHSLVLSDVSFFDVSRVKILNPIFYGTIFYTPKKQNKDKKLENKNMRLSCD